MNKNNKAVTSALRNNEIVDFAINFSHGIDPDKIAELLRHNLVDTGESLNYEADIHVANQVYSAYLDSQGRRHRVSCPE